MSQKASSLLDEMALTVAPAGAAAVKAPVVPPAAARLVTAPPQGFGDMWDIRCAGLARVQRTVGEAHESGGPYRPGRWRPAPLGCCRSRSGIANLAQGLWGSRFSLYPTMRPQLLQVSLCPVLPEAVGQTHQT